MNAGSRSALMRWYEPRRALYPWRRRTTAYRVLVSEVMLQQTQASRVAPAFRRFVRRFPTLRGLAAASRGDVVRAWTGLGYNRRAVSLAEATRTIVRDHGGRVPRHVEALRRLPGVGPYTAAAVASISFGVPEPAIDTNVGRVVSRAVLGREPREADPREIGRAARRWIDRDDPGGWNQAVMDLGREVCRPAPLCDRCPVASGCAFRRSRARVTPARRRRVEAFEGSSRQLRGRIVAALVAEGEVTIARLAASLSVGVEDVASVVPALVDDRLVAAGPGASAGRSGARLRLPD